MQGWVSYNHTGGPMKNAVNQAVTLDTAQVSFLQEMVEAYNLPDAGKAIRCVINYARDNPDKREAIFTEIRCLDC